MASKRAGIIGTKKRNLRRVMQHLEDPCPLQMGWSKKETRTVAAESSGAACPSVASSERRQC